jgi:alpha-D-ribose 1-methylphosphonate 5-triphosphate synthase subunit PhnH
MVFGGFVNPVLSAQSTFRVVLAATARPATMQPIAAKAAAPAPLSRSAAAVALTLCDYDTPVWLDAPLAKADVVEWFRFQCGAKIVAEPGAASFAFAAAPAELPPFESFKLGTPDYPDRSTTIVMLVKSFDAGAELIVAGPGMREPRALRADPLPGDVAERLARNHSLFPLGVDLLLVDEDRLAALPRSVRPLHQGGPPCT